MIYLRFETEQAANDRNMAEAMRRGCDMVTTLYWWPMIDVDGVYYLDVKDGDGLTDEERLHVINELPEQQP